MIDHFTWGELLTSCFYGCDSLGLCVVRATLAVASPKNHKYICKSPADICRTCNKAARAVTLHIAEN